MTCRLVLLFVFLLTTLPALGQDEDYVLSFSQTNGTPGTTIQVASLMDTTAGDVLLGIQYSVCHDEAVLDLDSDGLTGLDGVGWDTTFCTREVVDGGFVVGYLMNVITTAVIEPGEYEVVEAEYTILEDAEGGSTTTIEYCALGTPLVTTTFVSGAGDITPTTEEGVITIDTPTPFLRGDCKETGDVTVIDAIYMLESLFLAGPLSECLAACDVNGEDGMNILDTIHLLQYLYLNGDEPAEPFEDGCGTYDAQTLDECEVYDSCD